MSAETVTIVTAFVDIGRDRWEGVVNNARIDGHIKRNVDTYMQRFERLTKLDNPIVCFTESKHFDRIKAMRADIKLVSIDSLISDNLSLVDKTIEVQKNPTFVKFVTRPSVPEYWSEKYVLVTSKKASFVNYAVDNDMVSTDTVAWIDFGYCRDDTYCPPGMQWKYQTDGLVHMFCNSFIDINQMPIFEVVRTGEVFIQGCHVIAPKNRWQYMEQQFDKALDCLLSCGLSDDDQTLFLMAYRNDPSQFKINYVHPDSYWFMIFKDHNHAIKNERV